MFYVYKRLTHAKKIMSRKEVTSLNLPFFTNQTHSWNPVKCSFGEQSLLLYTYMLTTRSFIGLEFYGLEFIQLILLGDGRKPTRMAPHWSKCLFQDTEKHKHKGVGGLKYSTFQGKTTIQFDRDDTSYKHDTTSCKFQDW